MARTDQRSLEIPGLEGVRLCAAVGVVFIHATLIAEPLRHGGAAGSWMIRSAYLAVDILFVVSGFAQFLPLAAAGPDKLPPWRTYAIRRVARIVPPYYIACVATAIYIGHDSWGWGTPGGSVGALQFGAHLLFLNHILFGIVDRNGFGINSAMWTMTGEALFYLVLPFVARRFLRHPIRGLIGALAVALLWRLVSFIRGWDINATNFVSQFPAFAFHFAVGMAAAMVVVRLRRDPPTINLRWPAALGAAWSVAAIAAWLRAADPAHHGYSTQFLQDARWMWNLGFAVPVGLLLVCLPFAPRWWIYPLANPVFRWLGEGTYGAYLFHTIVLLMIGDKLHQLGWGPVGVWEIGLAASVEALLLGRLSYLIVEEPIRRWAKRTAAGLERRRSLRPQPAGLQVAGAAV